ncbi:hypothetical protein NEIPOLOT_02025, partial [Neisseria polysaccharea ATCC 43768]
PETATSDSAAFRRLCVETGCPLVSDAEYMSAAFRRLCVETSNPASRSHARKLSRLQAAVC